MRKQPVALLRAISGIETANSSVTGCFRIQANILVALLSAVSCIESANSSVACFRIHADMLVALVSAVCCTESVKASITGCCRNHADIPVALVSAISCIESANAHSLSRSCREYTEIERRVPGYRVECTHTLVPQPRGDFVTFCSAAASIQ